MRASLDTCAIIHIYRANLQEILFDFFDDGVFIYEQIRWVELENHGEDILKKIDSDINLGKIELYTDQKLGELEVLSVFRNNVTENKCLYGVGDLGEVYAIALAQTLGAYALVTDDIKQRGPYMSLLQFDDDIMPFSFADILILRYLFALSDEKQTVDYFNAINDTSGLNWTLRSQLARFIRRFFKNPYRLEDKEWLLKLVGKQGISIKGKLEKLDKYIKEEEKRKYTI